MKFGQIKKPLLYKRKISPRSVDATERNRARSMMMEGRREIKNPSNNNIEIKWNLNEMLLVKIAVISLNES